MLIAIDRMITRRRRTLTVLSAAFALGAAVVLAHGFIGGDHMGGMGGMSSSASICLAVAETAAVALALAAVVQARRTADPRVSLLPWVMPAVPQTPLRSLAVPARAGPPTLQVFRL